MEGEITRAYTVDKLTTIFDYDKLESGASVTSLALSGDVILATDKEKNSVYSLAVSSKEGSKVSGSFASPQSAAGYSDGFYIQTQSEVQEYVKASGKVAKVGDGSGWSKIVGAATYQSNLYLLDSGKNEIWRYLDSGTSLASAKAYTVGEKPDLTTGTGLAIDDYVWVVTKTGTLYKFAQGKKQEFSVTGLTTSLENVVGLFTNGASKNLYLLDKSKGLLVVIDKNGIYQAQYSHSDLRKASSVVVREDEKTAYLAVNGKLVSLKLR